MSNIIVEVIEEKLGTHKYNEKLATSIVTTLKRENLFDEKFTDNIEARIKVFSFISKIVARDPKQYYDLKMPNKS